MAVLSLVLAAPLQAWGSSSRFTTRASDDAPTKSGIIGLLAAAKGLRRTDPLEDLTNLRFGVRLDQPGTHLRDFQTARSLDERRTMPLSQRHYLADGRYVVGLEADEDLLTGIRTALLNPVFPLYLGRRSCPPSDPLKPILHDRTLESFLLEEPWQAADWWRRRHGERTTHLEFRIDAAHSSGELDAWIGGEMVQRDVPISFDPRLRKYGWRTVHTGFLPLPGRTSESSGRLSHDPMTAME